MQITSSGSSANKINGVIRVLESYMDKFEHDFTVEEVDPRRYFFLRPSSFPYCGFRKLLSAPKDLEGERLVEFASTYFTEIGHTTHSVFQRYAATGMQVVGDWWCKACKIEKKFSCKNLCSKCGKPMKYNELEIRYKGLVVGHTDGLFRLDPKLKKKSPHVLFDYKTTSTKKIWAHRKTKDVYPYKENVLQIESYAPLLEVQYDIEVSDWILIYLARDAPFKYGRVLVGESLTKESKAKVLKRINGYIKTHKKVLVAKTEKDFEAIEGRKLCSSLKDYKENHHNQYNPCPFADKCFTAQDKLIKTALKAKVWPIIDHAPKKIRKELNQILGADNDSKRKEELQEA
jgi:hypothetical protein